MKKILHVICIVLLSQLSIAWNGHDLLTYHLVKSALPELMNKYVRITEYQYNESRAYNLMKTVVGDWCEDLDGWVATWQILKTYSCEPDMGMDEGLAISPLQFFPGVDSHVVRHAKIRIFNLDLFQGDESFYYFVRMSKIAFSRDDKYWGYRFLARALHYIEDLSQPYHNKIDTDDKVLQVLDANYRHFLRKCHYAYDLFLAYLFNINDRKLLDAIENTPPIPCKDEKELVKKVREFSISKFKTVHGEIKRLFEHILWKRKVKMEDFQIADAKGQLEVLKEVTYQVISNFAGHTKYFLRKFMKEVRELN